MTSNPPYRQDGSWSQHPAATGEPGAWTQARHLQPEPDNDAYRPWPPPAAGSAPVPAHGHSGAMYVPGPGYQPAPAHPPAPGSPAVAPPTAVPVYRHQAAAPATPADMVAPFVAPAAPAPWPTLPFPPRPQAPASAPAPPVPTTTTSAASVWPKPADGVEQLPGPLRWQPAPSAAELVTPIFRGMLVSRLVTASVAHASHALDNLGVPATEPGPHAVLLLSALPQPVEPPVQRPSWYRPTGPQVPNPAPTAVLRVASRLIGIGVGDDLPHLLAELTDVAARQIAAAAQEKKLLHQHDDMSRVALAAQLTAADPWAPPAPFPYAQALTEQVLWDPRMPDTGLAPTSKDPLTPEVTYLGVAVTTLDTPTERWADTKNTWRGKRDTELGFPVTASSLRGTAWALLEDGTAMQIDRTPESTRDPRPHTVTANAPIERGFDRLTRLTQQPTLVEDAPPLPRLTKRPAQHCAELWDHLAGLHIVLRTAFGYQEQA